MWLCVAMAVTSVGILLFTWFRGCIHSSDLTGIRLDLKQVCDRVIQLEDQASKPEREKLLEQYRRYGGRDVWNLCYPNRFICSSNTDISSISWDKMHILVQNQKVVWAESHQCPSPSRDPNADLNKSLSDATYTITYTTAGEVPKGAKRRSKGSLKQARKKGGRRA